MKENKLLITEKLQNNHYIMASVDGVEIQRNNFDSELTKNEILFINNLMVNQNPYGQEIKTTQNIQNIINNLSNFDSFQNRLAIGLLEQIQEYKNFNNKEIENIHIVLYEH